MASVFKWIAWILGAILAICGLYLGIAGAISGLAAFGSGLCLIGVGIALHVLADIHLRIQLLYTDHVREKLEKESELSE